MLNIPDSVKALFNSDECRKNFRVHFPNGEHADLTNSDVVQESVVFSESLCSQNVLRFGLTEASVITFETVGVPNIMGVTIECSCEIDTSSLTAAEIAAIQAGTWDGTLVLAADSDLGYGFFRVPYGRFRVEDCPRNHGAMAHRKITARTIIGRRDIDNPFETAKLLIPLPGDTYTPDSYLLSMSGIGWQDSHFLEQQGFTGRELPRMQVVFGQQVMPYLQKTVTLKDSSGLDTDVAFYIYSAAISSSVLLGADAIDPAKLYSVDLHGVDYSRIKWDTITALQNHGIDYALSGYGSWEALVDDILERSYYPLLHIRALVSDEDTAVLSGDVITFSRDNAAFYPYRNVNQAHPFYVSPHSPYSVRIQSVPSGGSQWSETIFDLSEAGQLTDDVATFTEWTPPDGVTGLPILFHSTAQQSVTASGHPYAVNTFIGAFAYTDLINAFLEISANFGKPRRDGMYAVFRLNSASPVAIARSQYEECWWDEYDVEDVGTIHYSFVDGAGQTQETDCAFGPGRSVYDMSDNAMLMAMQDTSRAAIEALLTTQFIPNLGTLKFTPVDLSMLGLPYIEAGDYLEIAAEDGTTVRTYALEYELSGIQHLTAEIHSAGGEIIEEG